MVRLAACVGAMCLFAGLAPAGAARTPRVYMAVGDSVTNSGAPDGAWVPLFYRYLQADAHSGATQLVQPPSASTESLIGGDLKKVVKLIDGPSNVVALTLTTGGIGALGGGGCWVAPCPFPGSLTTILSTLNAALAKDPGRERVEVLAYYNPASGLGPPQETAYDRAGLGSDLKIDCAGGGASVGLNDDIACIGWQQGWIVVDAWSGFKAGGQSLVEGIHPSGAGHRLLATLFENACDLPAAGPGVPDPDGFLAARPAGGGPGCQAAAPIVDQIAFSRLGTAAGIYLVDGDGSSLRQLIRRGGGNPAWAPSGARLAYDTQRGVFIAGADGVTIRRLAEAGSRHPTWSPGGTRIAFVRRGSLYSVDTRGHHLRRITHPPRLARPRVQVRDSQPAWSPDGKRIAFVENRGGCDDSIWTISPSGHHRHRLTRSRPANSALSPDWSPDGGRIAFTFPVGVQHACQGARRALWVMKANGNSRHAFSAPAGLSAHDPSWSPDGSLMAFSASPPGTTNLGIYLLDINAGSVRQLTAPADPGQPGDATPAWRPLAP